MQPGCLRAVAALVAVLAGSTSLSATAATAATAANAAPSTGCGRRATPGSSTFVSTVDGHRRTVVVHVPSGYEDGRPVALVLNLHGSASDAHAQELFSGMDETADRDGFLVAYPQALIPDGSGFDWNVPGVPLVGGREPPKGAANDVTFLVDLVHRLEAGYCVDPREVFATGMSGGARMASQLACDASTTFAAVAPVAGLRLPSPCPANRAVPVVAFHGTADPVDPYGGNGQPYWTYSVPTAARRWAAEDRCAARAEVASHGGYTLTSYGDCAGGSRVELYSVAGEGHEWPGGPAMPARLTAVLGPQRDAVDANAVMWAFFAAHPMR